MRWSLASTTAAQTDLPRNTMPPWPMIWVRPVRTRRRPKD